MIKGTKTVDGVRNGARGQLVALVQGQPISNMLTNTRRLASAIYHYI